MFNAKKDGKDEDRIDAGDRRQIKRSSSLAKIEGGGFFQTG
jgi:hypothetical protein